MAELAALRSHFSILTQAELDEKYLSVSWEIGRQHRSTGIGNPTDQLQTERLGNRAN